MVVEEDQEEVAEVEHGGWRWVAALGERVGVDRGHVKERRSRRRMRGRRSRQIP